MSAVLIDLAAARMGRACRPAATPRPDVSRHRMLTHDFTFWRGATGARYVHTIYPLLECPELPGANVILVRRHQSGRAEVMHIGRVEEAAQCSNLAVIRHKAAQLGANEVHVHLLAKCAEERAAIEHDLTSAGEVSAGARN